MRQFHFLGSFLRAVIATSASNASLYRSSSSSGGGGQRFPSFARQFLRGVRGRVLVIQQLMLLCRLPDSDPAQCTAFTQKLLAGISRQVLRQQASLHHHRTGRACLRVRSQ